MKLCRFRLLALSFALVSPFLICGDATATSTTTGHGANEDWPGTPWALNTSALMEGTVFLHGYNQDVQFGTTSYLNESRLVKFHSFANAQGSSTINIGAVEGGSNQIATNPSEDWGSRSIAQAYFALDKTVLNTWEVFGTTGVSTGLVRVVSSNSTEHEFQNDNGPVFHQISYNNQGDATSGNDENSVDIIAHEYGHAITEDQQWFKSGLASPTGDQLENDALIEGFCDVFGFYTRWKVEEEFLGIDMPDANSARERFLLGVHVLDFPHRDLQDPGNDEARGLAQAINVGTPNCTDDETLPIDISGCIYERPIEDVNSPDSYCAASLNGAEHSVGGIVRKFFYLLSFGGSGTNSCGTNFEVCGVGADAAAQLIFAAVTSGELRGNTVTFADFTTAILNARTNVPPAQDPINLLYIQDALFAVGLPSGMGVEPISDASVGQILASAVEANAGEEVDLTIGLFGRNVDVPVDVCVFLSEDENLGDDNDVLLSTIENFEFDCDYSLVDQIKLTVTLPEGIEGEHHIIVDVDCNNDNPSDADPANNTSSREILIDVCEENRCKALDFRLVSIQPDLNDPIRILTRGVQSFSVTMVIENDSDLSYEPNSTDPDLIEGLAFVHLYIVPSTEPFSPFPFDQVALQPTAVRAIPALASNEQTTMNFTFLVPSNMSLGEKRVFAVADAREAVAETIEFTNNVALSRFIVRGRVKPPGGGGCKFPCLPDKLHEGAGFAEVYPNPSHPGQNIMMVWRGADLGESAIRITELVSGRQILNKKIEIESGLQLNLTKNGTNIPKGVYVIEVTNGITHWSQKITII